MVFHDESLDRMTNRNGAFRDFEAKQLREIRLGGSRDWIPTLREWFEAAGEETGLILELKGNEDEKHEEGFVDSVLRESEARGGLTAIMSFEHRLIREMANRSRKVPFGLTAEGGERDALEHRRVDDELHPDFLSYSVDDLDCGFVRDFRASGRPVICWTARSREQAEKAAMFADQITFEGFIPEDSTRIESEPGESTQAEPTPRESALEESTPGDSTRSESESNELTLAESAQREAISEGFTPEDSASGESNSEESASGDFPPGRPTA